MSKSILANSVFIKKAICKVCSKIWKQDAGIALQRTARLLHAFEDQHHIYVILGGSLAIGSIVLNGNHDTRDLIKEKKALDDAKRNFAGAVEKALTWRLEEIEDRLCDPEKEVVENYEAIKRKLQYDFGEISLVTTMMARFTPKTSSLENKLSADEDYADFKHVLQSIESTFESFHNGGYNLSHYFSTKPYYMFHLQTMVEKQLTPIKIQDHLDKTYEQYGYDACKELFSFVILSLSKNLQLTSAFFLFQHDLKRLVLGFERFNDFYEKLVIVFKSLTGKYFFSQRSLPPKNISSCHSKSNNDLYPHSRKSTLDLRYENMPRTKSKSSQDLRIASIKSATSALDRVMLSSDEQISRFKGNIKNKEIDAITCNQLKNPRKSDEEWTPFETFLKSPQQKGNIKTFCY